MFNLQAELDDSTTWERFPTGEQELPICFSVGHRPGDHKPLIHVGTGPVPPASAYMTGVQDNALTINGIWERVEKAVGEQLPELDHGAILAVVTDIEAEPAGPGTQRFTWEYTDAVDVTQAEVDALAEV